MCCVHDTTISQNGKPSWDCAVIVIRVLHVGGERKPFSDDFSVTLSESRTVVPYRPTGCATFAVPKFVRQNAYACTSVHSYRRVALYSRYLHPHSLDTATNTVSVNICHMPGTANYIYSLA